MRFLTQEELHNLPLHDSRFIGYKVSQKDLEFFEMILSFIFCDDEYESLKLENEKSGQFGSLIVPDCRHIKSTFYCNSYPPNDGLDYVEVFSNSGLLNEFTNKQKLKHIKIYFTSGSSLECIAPNIYFQFGTLI